MCVCVTHTHTCAPAPHAHTHMHAWTPCHRATPGRAAQPSASTRPCWYSLSPSLPLSLPRALLSLSFTSLSHARTPRRAAVPYVSVCVAHTAPCCRFVRSVALCCYPSATTHTHTHTYTHTHTHTILLRRLPPSCMRACRKGGEGSGWGEGSMGGFL